MTICISDEQVDCGAGSQVDFPCVSCTSDTRSDLGQDISVNTFLGSVNVVWWSTSGESDWVVLALEQWVRCCNGWFVVLGKNDGCHGSTGQKET